jgi:hypothetical protein
MSNSSDWSRTALMVAVILILITIVLEICAPEIIREGFAGALVPVTDKNYFGKFIPRRGDIGPEDEEGAFLTDKRYFNGYTDIQRIGVEHDWCRMVVSKNDTNDMFFACALAGTENLNSLSFRTEAAPSSSWSRDDYMRDTTGSGRADYCRIVKVDSETFETRCSIAGDLRFMPVLQHDPQPPPNIEMLLNFYDGILFWLRLRDDMLDYAKILEIYKAGGLSIEEADPKPPIARTLIFNGIDQFLRIGDSKSLEFGDQISLRTVRAFSFWVYFEEFTNNACILDFANGPSKDNIKIGILGKGNPNISEGDSLRPLLCGDASTVPSAPSGAQRVVETTPQRLMETSSANIEVFDCPGPAVEPIVPQGNERPTTKSIAAAKYADLLYEIWDSQQRKMRIVVRGAIPLQKWVHVAITAENNDSFRPDISVWINGAKTFTKPSGWLPQNSATTNNYIGKSNSYNVSSQYDAARDELFKGRLFDLRAYKNIMGVKKIASTVAWGKELLGL